jgi:hypothetical protein
MSSRQCKTDPLLSLTGYLAFFPYILGNAWKKQQHQFRAFPAPSTLTGRKLNSLVDLYIEERNKGKVVTPEYLTKKPCQFPVTEQLLKQILVARAEIVREMEEEDGGVSGDSEVLSAMANAELCRRWTLSFPNLRMTSKQLISIHEMLTYDTSKSSASPEIECSLSDVWKLLEKSVPSSAASSGRRRLRAGAEDDLEDDYEVDDDEAGIDFPEVEDKYDGETVSLDQMQEWLVETQGCPATNEGVGRRPRLAIKHRRRFWTESRLQMAETCRLLALAKRYWTRRRRARDSLCGHRPSRVPSLAQTIHAEWKRLAAGTEAASLSRPEILARCARTIRCEKRRSRKLAEKRLDEWRRLCEEFSRSEDLTRVIPEGSNVSEECSALTNTPPRSSVTNVTGSQGDYSLGAFAGRLTSLSKIASVPMASNAGRNFHKDDDVLAYIGDVQRMGAGGGAHITWTPEVIRDLIEARRVARSRKREWEAWATREFGGVGFAYNNPEVKTAKVDDMFKEEWAKLRPDMKNLSIWTLVSYARKYDNLKKQLIIDNGQQRENKQEEGDSKEDNDEDTDTVPTTRTIHTNVYFANSAIPLFDLKELHKLPYVRPEFRDLLISRQRAKETQERPENRGLSLAHLWASEWQDLHPTEPRSGVQLMRRLYELERIPGYLAAIAPAILRRAVVVEADEDPKEPPQPDEDEVLRLVPRKRIFPEDEERHGYPDEEYVNANCKERFWSRLRVTVEKVPVAPPKRPRLAVRIASFSKDVHALAKHNFAVPALELEGGERLPWDDADDEEDDEDEVHGPSTLPPKSRALRLPSSLFNPPADPAKEALSSDRFRCLKCSKDFHNVNNFHHHIQMH